MGLVRGDGAADPAHHLGGIRGVVDVDRRRAETLHDAVGTQGHGLHLCWAGEAGADHFAPGGYVSGIVRPDRPSFDQRSRGFGPKVVDHQREPRVEQPARHGLSHVPEADEPYLHCAILPPAIEARSGAVLAPAQFPLIVLGSHTASGG